MTRQYKALLEKAKLNSERAIECREVFKNPMIDLTPLRKEFEKNKELFKGLPVKSVKISEVVPTQDKIYISSLEATNDISNETGAYLVFRGGKYYIFDGHHRIANRILKGHNTFSGYVYTPGKKAVISNLEVINNRLLG